MTACRLHGVDPGPALLAALGDASPGLRAAGLRTAGETGGTRLLEQTLEAMQTKHPSVAFEAAWAAALMGDRTVAPSVLWKEARRAPITGGRRSPLLLSLLVAAPEQSHRMIREIANGGLPEANRWRAVIRACGWAGHVDYIPWLIECTDDDKLARLAGEAISMLMGVDLSVASLTRPRPMRRTLEVEDQGYPDYDEDEELPWPEPGAMRTWWAGQSSRFPPMQISFMGAVPGEQSCRRVLATGTQRQRLVAALRLKILKPETALFNVFAPAWRQRRALQDRPAASDTQR